TSGDPGEWYKFERVGGALWVAAQYVTLDTAIPTATTSPFTVLDLTGKVNDSNVFYRSAPSTVGNEPIGQLMQGETVKIIGKQTTSGDPSSWYKVTIPDGPYWVAEKFVDVNAAGNNGQGPTLGQPGQEVQLDVPWF